MAEVFKLPSPSQDGSTKSSLFEDCERLTVLIPGGEGFAHDPTFGDGVWNLAGHSSWKGKSGAQTSINFARMGEKWQVAAKEMAILQLNPELAALRAPENPMAQAWQQVQEQRLCGPCMVFDRAIPLCNGARSLVTLT